MARTLIALAVIAAGLVSANSPELTKDQKFEAADDVADKLIADGLAKEDVVAPKVKETKVRLLIESHLGKCNDVVAIPSDQVKQLESEGFVDSNKAAVAYALSLKADD